MWSESQNTIHIFIYLYIYLFTKFIYKNIHFYNKITGSSHQIAEHINKRDPSMSPIHAISAYLAIETYLVKSLV